MSAILSIAPMCELTALGRLCGLFIKDCLEHGVQVGHEPAEMRRPVGNHRGFVRQPVLGGKDSHRRYRGKDESALAPDDYHWGSLMPFPGTGSQDLPVIIQKVLHAHEDVLQPEVLPVLALDTEREEFSQGLADDQVPLVEVLVSAGHGHPAAVGGTKSVVEVVVFAKYHQVLRRARRSFSPPEPKSEPTRITAGVDFRPNLERQSSHQIGQIYTLRMQAVLTLS